jgi:endonuclease-3
MTTLSIPQVVELLEKNYGKRKLAANHNPVAELVLTILSQNTSDANSRPAFQSLVERFPRWDDILAAQSAEIAETIRKGGLGLIKAQRLQKALAEIKNRREAIELDFLESMPLLAARAWLMELPGVGYKTANCVLLFALGRPALPVDTHIFRISKRLGLIPSGASLERAHEMLAGRVPDKLIYPFHVLMIEHGRRTCLAQRPRCPICFLRRICRTGKARKMAGPDGES